MNQPVIPPSPSADDYAFQLAANADDTIFNRDEPIGLFIEWLEEAKRSEVNDANAMVLATVDPAGLPDVRMVLLKDVDDRGFTFFSNQESAKGEQLWAHPSAALLFHWKSLRRQVRIRGAVEPVSLDEANVYFASRARESRIGAWASDQSRPLSDREALEARVAEQTARFEGQDVPRPDRWTGWRVRPEQIEFWRDRPFRLHDRLRFDRDHAAWVTKRLWP
ncbi:MAG: pyridoxamine 5'-phosphate oxidase [Proteobacteria bacterium]|nr:pyridoxamine 5'-phosphate oxidase [Pseudomonadota bacterium]MDA1321124.1 pyridoxamine 5'-phosphate oxidase [Pseudomonadota bacterium]